MFYYIFSNFNALFKIISVRSVLILNFLILHDFFSLLSITESITDDLINEALLKVNFNATFDEIINNLIGMELFQVS